MTLPLGGAYQVSKRPPLGRLHPGSIILRKRRATWRPEFDRLRMFLKKIRVCGDADTWCSGLRPEDLLRTDPLGFGAGWQKLRVVQQVAEFFEPVGCG
jgi:hypothetical protein